MAYHGQKNFVMPDERSLLMAFSVHHFSEDDKLCHHMNLDVLQEIYPLEAVEEVLDDCHAWEKREKALNMVTILYLVIALTLFPRLMVGGVLRRLASGARFLWPDPTQAVASEGAICQRRHQLGVTPVRHLFRRCCRPQATPQTKDAFHWGRRVVAIDGTSEDDLDPDRLSFSHAVEVVQQAVHEVALVALEERPTLMERLRADLRSSRLPARRLRFNARVVKRPLSRFRRKRYWNLDGPHLKGTSFTEILLI